jgi:acyl-CoA thioester hydrolase
MHENFFHNIKVYYEDTDAGGIVYYANYLKFLERARTEALVKIGFNNKKIKDDYGALIIVKSCNIEYRKPSYLEDELKLGLLLNLLQRLLFLCHNLFLEVTN